MNTNLTRVVIAVIIMILGIGITFVVFDNAKLSEEQRLRADLERRLASEQENTRRSFDLLLQSITTVAANLGASQSISSSEFTQQTENIVNTPGVNYVSWIPRVLSSDRLIHQLTMRRQGLDDYTLQSDFNDDEATLFPFTFIQSDPQSAAIDDVALSQLIGVNLGQEQHWLTKLNEARDSGSLKVNDRLIVSDSIPNDNFHLFIPVYLYGLPNDLGPRRINLRGYLLFSVSLDHFLVQALSADSGLGDDLKVQIAPADADADAEQEQEFMDEGLRLTSRLTIGDTEWDLTFITDEPLLNPTDWQLYLIPFVGLVITILIVTYYVLFSQRTAQIQRLVVQRTEELQRANIQIKESQAQMIHAEKMSTLGQTVAGVVHEINTPVAFVTSSISLSKDNFERLKAILANYDALVKRDSVTAMFSTEERERLAEIDREIQDELLEETEVLLQNGLEGLETIRDLVITLKDFSRLDRAEWVEYDVNHGLDNALKMVHHLTKDHIRVTKNYTESLYVHGSTSQINQVFLNLLVNACHALEDAEQPQITLATEHEADRAIIRVQDNGKGIAQEHIDRIFEPFFTTKGSGKGTGLGLAIVNGIIQGHQGTITVDSVLSEGTTFTIKLPFDPASHSN